jgi:serine/threonine-protein kinase RsbW
MSVTAACLRLDGQNSTVEAIACFVAMLARDGRLSQRKAYWLRLAAEEITTNIVQHGYHGCGPVWLEGRVSADVVSMRIEDEAPAFDPTAYDRHYRLAEEPAQRDEGGFGLLLALHNLDGFFYEYVGGRNRNELIMCRTIGEADGNVNRAGRG